MNSYILFLLSSQSRPKVYYHHHFTKGNLSSERLINLFELTQPASDDPRDRPDPFNSEPTALNSVLQTFIEPDN